MKLFVAFAAFVVGAVFGCLGTCRVAYLERAAEERAKA